MDSRGWWVAIAVLVLVLLVVPDLGGGTASWAGGPVVQSPGAWGWGHYWCGY